MPPEDGNNNPAPSGQEPHGTEPAGGNQEPQNEPKSEPDWKAEARKWEQRARDNKKVADQNKSAAEKLAQIEAQNQTAQEKAEAAAKAADERARAAVERVAKAEVKAALTGIVEDAAAFAEDLNLRKYITDDGDVDSDAIAKLRDRYKAMFAQDEGKGPRAPKPNPAHGSNGSQPPKNQLAADALKNMSPEEIVKAQRDGLLDHVLGAQK